MVTQASGRARRDPQRFVDSSEIVVDRMDRNHSHVILNLLAETICQSGKAPHAHPHCQIVAFHVGRADVLGIRIAAYGFHFAPDAGCWGISRVVLCWCAVNFCNWAQSTSAPNASSTASR
jgi:hypothetical protein